MLLQSHRKIDALSFPFLSLPGEVRTLIYALLILSQQVIYCPSHKSENFLQRHRPLFPAQIQVGWLAILRVCRQTYGEASLIFYAKNTFHFLSEHAYTRFYKCLTTRSLGSIVLIRHLVIEVLNRRRKGLFAYQLLRCHLPRMPSLQRLEFAISRRAPHVNHDDSKLEIDRLLAYLERRAAFHDHFTHCWAKDQRLQYADESWKCHTLIVQRKESADKLMAHVT